MEKSFLMNQLKAIWEHITFATRQEDDYTTVCLLDYNYSNDHYKIIANDLNKQQQTLDADPKAVKKKLVLVKI